MKIVTCDDDEKWMVCVLSGTYTTHAHKHTRANRRPQRPHKNTDSPSACIARSRHVHTTEQTHKPYTEISLHLYMTWTLAAWKENLRIRENAAGAQTAPTQTN